MSEINRLADELIHRSGIEQNWQRDLLFGRIGRPNLVNFVKYWRHRAEYEAKQRRVKKLLDEFDRRPCKPDITGWRRKAAGEPYPDDEYLWNLWGQTIREMLSEGPGEPQGPVLFPGVAPIPVYVVP